MSLWNKKQLNYTLSKITPLNPDDIVMVKFSQNIPIEDVSNYFQFIKSVFPEDTKMIGIIDGITIDIESWQRVYDYLMSIKPQEENNND